MARAASDGASTDLCFRDGRRLTAGRTAVMGVLNITPDSFSDGGRHLCPADALDAAEQMLSQGADLLDVGGESTRPGATAVSAEEEIRRIEPIVEALKRSFDCRISIDSYREETARRALDLGADMINDIRALEDPSMGRLAQETDVPVVLMHMRGEPRTMQADTGYTDVVGDVVEFLAQRREYAIGCGIDGAKIVLDPGIGFGKSTRGNLSLLASIDRLHALGSPVLIGASRKRFIGELLDLPVEERLEGSLAVAAHAASSGVKIVRVHDVAQTVRVTRIIDAIRDHG